MSDLKQVTPATCMTDKSVTLHSVVTTQLKFGQSAYTQTCWECLTSHPEAVVPFSMQTGPASGLTVTTQCILA